MRVRVECCPLREILWMTPKRVFGSARVQIDTERQTRKLAPKDARRGKSPRRKSPPIGNACGEAKARGGSRAMACRRSSELEEQHLPGTSAAKWLPGPPCAAAPAAIRRPPLSWVPRLLERRSRAEPGRSSTLDSGANHLAGSAVAASRAFLSSRVSGHHELRQSMGQQPYRVSRLSAAASAASGFTAAAVGAATNVRHSIRRTSEADEDEPSPLLEDHKHRFAGVVQKAVLQSLLATTGSSEGESIGATDLRWALSMAGATVDLGWLTSMHASPEQFAHVRGEIETAVKHDEDGYSYLTELMSREQLRGKLLPYSRWRSWWDSLTLLLVFYTAISVPLLLSLLDDSALSVPTRCGLSALDLLMDVLFLVDVCLNFFTAFVKDGVLVIDLPQIRSHYLRTWFPIDAVASIPWEVCSLAMNGGYAGLAAGADGGGSRDVTNLVKVLKVPKLLRLGRLFKVLLSQFEGAANIGRILVLILILCLLVHWFACIWYVIVANTDDGWLDAATIEAVAGPVPSDAFARYVFMFHATLLMIMGENMAPVRPAETLFVIVAVISGACVNAIIFANVASLVTQLGEQSAQHHKKMEEVSLAMKILGTRPAVVKRVLSYFEYVHARHHDHDGERFIRKLPHPLRLRISYLLFESLLRKCDSSVLPMADSRRLMTHGYPQLASPACPPSLPAQLACTDCLHAEPHLFTHEFGLALSQVPRL